MDFFWVLLCAGNSDSTLSHHPVVDYTPITEWLNLFYSYIIFYMHVLSHYIFPLPACSLYSVNLQLFMYFMSVKEHKIALLTLCVANKSALANTVLRQKTKKPELLISISGFCEMNANDRGLLFIVNCLCGWWITLHYLFLAFSHHTHTKLHVDCLMRSEAAVATLLFQCWSHYNRPVSNRGSKYLWPEDSP